MGETSRKMTSCMRCGTCCRKGGPALHGEDRPIITAGHIRNEHLVTIREGELARIPDCEGLSPTGRELVKIAGKAGTWECLLFDEEESSCMIYENRPLECRVLKCWDTAELLSVIGKDGLRRADIIEPGDPMLEVIEAYEERCPVRKMEDLLSALFDGDDKAKYLEELEELLQEDLNFRGEAASGFGLSLSVELFLFGRPLFKLLGDRGLSVGERKGRLKLSLRD